MKAHIANILFLTGSPKLGMLFALLAIITGQPLMAQFEGNYTPIRMEGTLPQEVIQAVSTTTTLDLSQDKSTLTQREKVQYYTLSNYVLSRTMRSGKVYFGGEITDYLNNILDVLLADEPELRSEINLYATRISIPNATSWRDGTLFFNLPLLTYMESEAQIAFILCHEIAHYEMQHSLLEYEKKAEIQRNRFSSGLDTEEALELLRYSRDQESEADSLGFKRFLNSPYASSEALGALDALKKIDEPYLGNILDMEALWGLDKLASFEDCTCDSTKIFGKWGLKKLLLSQETEEEEEEESDTLSTHPSLDSRVIALAEMLTAQGATDEKVINLQGEDTFDRIRLMAYFEFVQQNFLRGNYVRSLYTTLRMRLDFPENEYLNVMAAKNLYWMAFYQKRGQLKEDFLGKKDYETFSFGSYHCFLSCINESDFREFSQLCIQTWQERFPDSGPLMVYRAQLAELVGETDEAMAFYNAYTAQFPEGSYHQFARYRLNDFANQGLKRHKGY